MSKKTSIIITLILITGYASFASALINPGDTLNPVVTNPTECPNGPTDPTCIVTLPSGGSVTANNGLTATGSNVQLGGTLLQNTTVNQAGFDFSIMNGNLGYQNNTSIGGLGFPGTGSVYVDAQEQALNGIIDGGAAFSRFPTMYYHFDDGLGFPTTRYVTLGDTSIEMRNTEVRLGDTVFSKLDLGGSELSLRQENTTSGAFAMIDVNTTGSLSDSISFSTDAGRYTFPRTDGTANQVLTTNGSGQLSWTTPLGGGSGWSLTGNSGTTAGTNFIGTTDAQDFMVKTNGSQVALFGQNGNVAMGIDGATGPFVGLAQSPVASGIGSTAFGLSTTASGTGSFALAGNGMFGPNEARGDLSFVQGEGNVAYSFKEFVIGDYATAYTPLGGTNGHNDFDRSFVIGNHRNNSLTMWKDGSFAYNDDNFQNDNAGTEQNMFYFNYGNHDGLGGAQTKRAIRLGSASNDEWDIGSANVGENSIAIGFADLDDIDGPFPAPTASGRNSISLGAGSLSQGENSFSVFGNGQGRYSAAIMGSAQGEYSFAAATANAQGTRSVAFGKEVIAIANNSFATGYQTEALGDRSAVFGHGTKSFSWAEFVLGSFNTSYVPQGGNLDFDDRLFVVGNGTSGSESDALTILKNGQTGIGIDNFETNTNGNIFQVGDGGTNIIAYVDSGTGAWVPVSDERQKHNIQDLTYGLNEINKLRPVSFNYNRNNEHTIGFLAQQVKDIIPEAVFGDEDKGYGMSYQVLTPALVKAIQELNLKVDLLSMDTGTSSESVFEGLIAWLENTGNGIRSIVVKDKICVDDQCLTKDDIRGLLEMKNQGNLTTVVTSPVLVPTPDSTIDSVIDPVTDPIGDQTLADQSSDPVSIAEPEQSSTD